MNYLSIILKEPKLLSIAEKYLETDVKKYATSIYNIWKKTDQVPSKESVLSFIKEDVIKQEFENAYKCTDADIELFKEAIKQEQLQQYSNDVGQMILENKSLDPIELKRIYEKTVTIKDTTVENEFEVKSINDMFSILKEIESDDCEAKMNTGYNQINDVVGGWKSGSTYCVMGLSGIGKSIFLANFASRLWYQEQKNVLYITTEMNHKQTYDRILRASLNATKSSITEQLLKLQKLNQSTWGKINVVKIHPNDQTCDDIQNIIDEMKWKPDAIVIDYFDEIRASDKTANEYEKHGVVASDMKKLAEVNDCPVITATQTNRNGASEKGAGTKEYMGQGDISDSHKKVRTLDVLFGIIQTASMLDGDQGQYELQVIKNRYGKTGVHLYFKINYLTMRLDEELSLPKISIKQAHQKVIQCTKLDKYFENLKGTFRGTWEPELKELKRKGEIDKLEFEELKKRLLLQGADE